ncbi:HD-like signal output (HDOD) protein/CheY-like chemotaxis protein [Actinoplanes tereljensis]|uniref:Two-component system response regulator n=1 Tax=Paractinoplanes tereljensis TaxID=571912 RepID=A0A919NQB4_9ACTN|nr:HDOD domain-containing protein [Actinoplanes tereljensis]GIF22378.1 two-component system response regulator [Actinoplanes tereljensis]
MTPKPHVLFVDDEPRVLDGLRRMLRGQRNRWEMSFAGGGAEALVLLGERHCDVVVSDFRMPEIDGAALLEKVRTLSPDTARIILSGQTSADNVMRVMTLAHQFLNKPATSDEIIEAIEQVLGAQETTSASAGLISDVSGVQSLPSPPALLAELLGVLEDEKASASSIGQVIGGDPAVAAKILNLANSSACTAGRRLADITQAVALLGTNVVRGLVLLHDIVSVFTEGVHLPAAWLDALNTHSVQCAQLANRLATGKDWASHAFTAGLLHEVGQLVLATSRPDPFGVVVSEWRQAGEAAETAAAGANGPDSDARGAPALGELESAGLGTSHSDAGASLLSLWGLPSEIVEAAARHARTETPTTAEDLNAAVALAHAAVEQEFGPVCGARPTSPIDETTLGPAERNHLHRWRAALRPPE